MDAFISGFEAGLIFWIVAQFFIYCWQETKIDVKLAKILKMKSDTYLPERVQITPEMIRYEPKPFRDEYDFSFDEVIEGEITTEPSEQTVFFRENTPLELKNEPTSFDLWWDKMVAN
ncbi:hypothetical protein HC928_04525 [bacterium]|nr:hypothetical protein [bacterium]